ncbi:MAG: glucose-1-phosphate thymidylyltransferase RfbA [Hyphomicrobiales bacterium]
MKGIILAGGTGTRLHPATIAVNKQLLPVYDKPMIYYPMSVLMLAGIRDILIISGPEFIDNFKRLFADGSAWGLRLAYAVQKAPEGLAQAFTIGREFIGKDRVALVLGDNIFFGHGMSEVLRRARERSSGATVFAYHVEDPQRYGVVAFDAEGRASDIIEKPAHPRSHWAVTGLYFYDNRVIDIASSLEPSARGEYEITDVNRAYLAMGELVVEQLGRGYAWLDTGTHDALLEAAQFVHVMQKRQGTQIACLEEIAYRNGFIGEEELRRHGRALEKTAYGRYILAILEGKA